MFRWLMDGLRKLLRRKPAPPDMRDPYAGARVPLRKGPNNRSGAIALEEPDE